jgi:hypothetical protein
MRKTTKIIFSTFVLLIVFSSITSFVTAQGGTPFDVPNADTYQGQLQANMQYEFQFRQRTRLRINASVNIDMDISCDALDIGDKTFELELEAENDLTMHMVCKRDMDQLGLMDGYTYQIRNRHQHRYQEGFAVSMECNGTFIKARLRIQATNQNRDGTWAYYDEVSEEWVPVQTHLRDGYLEAETDHFSTWTILVPDTTVVWVGIVIGGVISAVVLVGVIVYYKRRR